jgi:hypothetical protein
MASYGGRQEGLPHYHALFGHDVSLPVVLHGIVATVSGVSVDRLEKQRAESMDTPGETGQLLARCIVCRGNIYGTDAYEVWEEAFYCERHSLPRLRERAREYGALLAPENASQKPR